MPKVEKKFKRGDKVLVTFEGIVIRTPSLELGDGAKIMVSVKVPKMKEAWWAIVPEAAVKKAK